MVVEAVVNRKKEVAPTTGVRELFRLFFHLHEHYKVMEIFEIFRYPFQKMREKRIQPPSGFLLQDTKKEWVNHRFSE